LGKFEMSTGRYCGNSCFVNRPLWLWLALTIPSTALSQEVRHYDGRCTNTTVGLVARVSIDMRISSQTISGEVRISPPLGNSGAFSGAIVSGICTGTSVTGIKFFGKCDGTAFDPVFSAGNEVGYCTTRLVGPLAARPTPNPPREQPAPVGVRRQLAPVEPTQSGALYPDTGPRRE
jgi:hypothetical protein